MAENKYYPQFFERIKSWYLDLGVMVALAIITSIIFNQFEVVNDYYRIGAFIGVFFLYDPILVSLFGGTFGHYAMKIRVKRKSDETKNIIFPLAIVRYIIKLLLGTISFFSVGRSKTSQTIHDLAVNSVVVYKK